MQQKGFIRFSHFQKIIKFNSVFFIFFPISGKTNLDRIFTKMNLMSVLHNFLSLSVMAERNKLERFYFDSFAG